MKRDPLLWAALGAVLVVLASAEYELARACGFGTYVAAGVPAALDIYALRALRVGRDVAAVVASLILVNAASHLVSAGLLPVNTPLVVAVSAIAPLVLWRVHRLSAARLEGDRVSTTTDPLAEPAEPAVVPEVPEPAAAALERAPVPQVMGPWQPLPELLAAGGGTSTGTDREQGGRPHPEPEDDAPEPEAEPAAPESGTSDGDEVPEESAESRFERHVAAVRGWLEAEPELTGTKIGQRLGVSDTYGRRVRRAAIA